MKNSISKYTGKTAERILFLLLLAQILFLMIFNILHMKYLVNFDSNTYLVQVMQIWKQRTLLIKDYYYSTMLTWDMPTLPAVLIYAIFRDVFLAYALADDLLILLFALTIHKLCRDMELSKTAQYLVMIAIFATYQYGSVDYMEELFVNGALYGFRILFLLLMMDVLLCIHKKRAGIKEGILYILALVGFFLCGISSGIFEVGCCILPLLLYEFFYALGCTKEFRLRNFLNRRMFLVCFAVVVSLAGLLTNRLLHLSSSSAMEKGTMAAEGLGENISNAFFGIFQLLGWPQKSVKITSLEGVFAFGAVAVSLAVLAVFVLSTKAAWKKEGLHPQQQIYCGQVFCIFLVNALLFCFADLTYGDTTFEYRYWVMTIIPIFLEFGILYDGSKGRISNSYRHFWLVAYVLLAGCISLYKNYGMWQEDWGGSQFDRWIQVAEEQECDTVFVYSDYFSSRVFLAFAPEDMDMFGVNNYSIDDTGTTWIEDELRMPRWGNYVKYDGDCLELEEDKKIGMFIHSCIGQDYERLLAKATSVTQLSDAWAFVVVDDNYMDFVYGIPEEDSMHSRDYPNWGYERTHLALDEKGDYCSDGQVGTLLSGEFSSDQKGDFTVVLTYEMLSCWDTEEPAMLTVKVTAADGAQISYEAVLTQDQTQASIDGISLAAGDSYQVLVQEKEGTVVSLQQIDYLRND